ncbi:hypothetical protein [Nocardioides ganghwensis]|uniref:Exo-alpha-sialidase n=1 Tax=Nocardioides ganghwensis TaxID=252230 RepID=A0A4Q2S9Z3_9ACTN|nr:hypothetical protein [Nocardioides ganghwensis]MBD3947151.1 hypothetical protein [Nocardioides ganghwensis]RYC00659.1 hypothetical protein EUA07_13255 [Nocardioides ganghwensis]
MRFTRIAAAGALVLGTLGPPAEAAVPGGGWGDPVRVSGAAGDIWDLELAVHRGRGLAVWVRWRGEATRVEAAWQRGDGAWSDPVAVEGTRDASEVEVAYDALGRPRLVWTRGRRVVTARLERDGSTTRPVVLHRTAAGPLGTRPAYVRLALHATGTAVVGWQAVDDDEAPPYATSSVQVVTRDAAGGDWTTAQTLSSPEVDATRPEVVVDRSGRATVAWGEQQGRTWRVRAASRSAGSSWGAPETLSATSEQASAPQLAGLPFGRLGGRFAVAWPTRTEDGHGVVVRQWDGAAGWSAPVTVRSARLPGWVDLGLSRHGPVVAFAASTRRVDARQRVLVARVSPTGEVDRSRLAPRVSVYYGMHVVVNRAGDALVAWDSVRGGDHPVEAAYGARDGSWGPVTRVSAVGGDAFLGAVALRRDGDGLAVWNGGDLEDPDSSRVWARTYVAQ